MLTAHDLFYLDGIRATGIDKVVAESGVTKVTFYWHRRWMDWFIDALRRHGAKQSGGLTPLVPILDEWFSNPIYRGCVFINTTVAEFGDTMPEALEICRAHKQDMVKVIADLLPDNASRQ